MGDDQKRTHAFLSHASFDKDIANELQDLIERVSLRRVKVWFSNDVKPTGGMGAGNWHEEIKRNLREAKLVIALLTRESLNLPWIAFECGFGAAVSNDKVIPVVLGLDIEGGIPKPLTMFTAYQLTDVGSVNVFLARALKEFEIEYDATMAEAYVKPAVTKFGSLNASRQNDPSSQEKRFDSGLLREIKSYIDQALMNTGTIAERVNAQEAYTVPIRFSFPRLQADDFLPIRPQDTVADKMIEVFKRISGHVRSYSYLVEWIIRDITNGVDLIVREIQDRIPASCIFQPGTQWEVVPLKEPYSGQDSWSEPWGEPTDKRTRKPTTPAPWEPKQGDGEGPRSPDVSKPDSIDLLKRMRKVDPNQSKKYRRRTGE